jgi:acyl-CoA thioester hydrolase
VSVSRRLAEQADRLDAGNYPVRFAHRTLYSDMDPNRHLNNGAFGRLFEEGRADLHHRIIGMSAASAAVNELTLLLATITIEFLREGRYPGSVEVASGVLRVGVSSYGLAQAAFQDAACIALAECVMVKASRGGPVPLTETERELLADLAFHGTLLRCSTRTRSPTRRGACWRRNALASRSASCPCSIRT